LASGIVVIDLDSDKGGLEAWQGLVAQHGQVETLSVITGSGGRHLYFRAPEEVLLKSTADRITPGIDTRAEGGYAVVPPSIHFSGHRYQWANSWPAAPLPDWLLNLWPKQGSHSQPPQEANGDEPILEGQRNTTLISLAGSMRRRGMRPESIEGFTGGK
jgi:putative DNA primase/helicase